METKYKILISWSEEDHAFVAEVPELPGCAADGASHQEALLNAETVIQEWIDTARELGRPVPVPGQSPTHRKQQNSTFELYKDPEGKWRYRLRQANGNIIAVSDKGYATKDAAWTGLQSLREGAAKAPVEEVTV